VQERQRNERIGFDMNANVQLGQFFGRQARVTLPFFYGYSLGLINPEYDPYNPDVRLADYDSQTRKDRARDGQDFTERKSYNFTGVRKELKAGATPRFWRVSNWSASYAYSEDLKRDFNTNYDRTKTWTGGLNYNYSFRTKPIEPFKKMKFLGKSKWLAIVRDMNLYLTPKNISFTNDLLRTYNERQVRNNLVPDYEFAPLYLKRFNWNRTYNLGYDVTKNLKVTFSAANRAIFEEGDGRVDRKLDPLGYQAFKDSIFNQMSSFGRTMDYSHNYNVSYTLPLDKIPATDWMSANVKYTGTYNWQRAPLGQADFGNTIQNNRQVNMTGQLNFTNLYNKVPYLKKVTSDGKNVRGTAGAKNAVGKSTGGDPKAIDKPALEDELKPDKPVEDMTPKELRQWERKKKRHERKKKRAAAEKKRNGKVHPVAGFFARLLMTVRNVSGTYALNDGTMLPGYNQETSVLGFSSGFNAPLAGFVFGQQRYDLFGRETGYNIASTAAGNGWLVQNQDLNRQFTNTHSQNLNLRASLEPMKDLTIELTATRTFGNNSNEFFRWNDATSQYESQSKVETGTLTYTTMSIGSAFALIGKEYESATFDNLLSNRELVSQLLGAENSNSSQLISGYYSGYNGAQQEVVTGAFLTSYTNRGVDSKNINPVKNVPLPNWSINYNGLNKFEFAKKYVRNFVIRHAYSSTISVSGLQTNLNAEFDQNGNAMAMDINNNFIAERQLQNVTMTERFSPLIGFDATWNIKSKGESQGLITKFEYKKDRSATLSLNNNQVTEVLGNEWVIGSGYKFSKVKLPIDKISASDLNIRFDMSFRDNLTVVRKIVENTNQATAGQRVISIKTSADYNVTQNLTVQLYYDQVLNTPKIATSYPTGNMSTGIRLRFNLAGVQ
jgi:cell surface protein SprA